MADKTGKVQDAIWPMPKFYFRVTWENVTIHFAEVSGLDTQAQIVEYRHANNREHATVAMPGIKKVGNVTMKRGIFAGDTTFYDCCAKINLNTLSVGRTTVIVQLLDEKAQPTMTWELRNAWPTKITSTDLKSDGNEAAIDTLEIYYEILMTRNDGNA